MDILSHRIDLNSTTKNHCVEIDGNSCFIFCLLGIFLLLFFIVVGSRNIIWMFNFLIKKINKVQTQQRTLIVFVVVVIVICNASIERARVILQFYFHRSIARVYRFLLATVSLLMFD